MDTACVASVLHAKVTEGRKPEVLALVPKAARGLVVFLEALFEAGGLDKHDSASLQGDIAFDAGFAARFPGIPVRLSLESRRCYTPHVCSAPEPDSISIPSEYAAS